MWRLNVEGVKRKAPPSDPHCPLGIIGFERVERNWKKENLVGMVQVLHSAYKPLEIGHILCEIPHRLYAVG